ncbi:hypothetical protein ACWGOK_34515 [Streptomyces eurythermus]
MDRVDLEHRHRTYDGWIPPTVAALLHEHGHHDILRHAAAHGDWFCARRLAEAAAESGPDGRAAALALLEPFAATGWWPAVDTVAGLFAEWEYVDQAGGDLGCGLMGAQRLGRAGVGESAARSRDFPDGRRRTATYRGLPPVPLASSAAPCTPVP